MLKKSLIFITVLLCLTVSVMAVEITTADGNGADTYITNDTQSEPNYLPDTYHGTENQLKMRNYEGVRMKIILLRFDVSQLPDIQDAVIHYNVTWYKGASVTISMYGLVNEDLDNWPEDSTCYNNAPGFVPFPVVPIAYYDMTEDLQPIGHCVYPKDSLGWNSSTPSDTLDDFINSDTNGLITLVFMGPTYTSTTDADWAWSSKEDSVIYAPKLIAAESTGLRNENHIPTACKLRQNYPNPFNPVTSIEFSLENPGHTTLEIYNLQGQLLETLIDGQMESGNHLINFRADKYTSGIYLYKLKSNDFMEVKKMMLMK